MTPRRLKKGRIAACAGTMHTIEVRSTLVPVRLALSEHIGSYFGSFWSRWFLPIRPRRP
jgi:hypothetical protein